MRLYEMRCKMSWDLMRSDEIKWDDIRWVKMRWDTMRCEIRWEMRLNEIKQDETR